MIPGQLIAPGQLTDPGVNFASVHCLTPVTVHTEFFIAPGQLQEVGYPLFKTGYPHCWDNFSPCEQNAKVAPGKHQLHACLLLLLSS